MIDESIMNMIKNESSFLTFATNEVKPEITNRYYVFGCEYELERVNLYNNTLHSPSAQCPMLMMAY